VRKKRGKREEGEERERKGEERERKVRKNVMNGL
jgi:hypothetical protein